MARSRWVLEGQTRPCAHSRSRVPKNRSIFPFQRGCAGRDEDVAGVELGEDATELVAGGVALRVVAHDRLDRAAALIENQTAARRRVAETLIAFSAEWISV
jgi:hypothetical protein